MACCSPGSARNSDCWKSGSSARSSSSCASCSRPRVAGVPRLPNGVSIGGMRHTALAIVAVCGIAAAAGLEARQTLTKQDADTFDRKLSAIINRGSQTPTRSPQALRTVFTDREVNAYFKYNSQSFMPVGVLEPTVTIGDAGLVKAR